MIAFFKDPVLLAAALATSLPFLSMAVILIFTRHHQRLSAALSIGAVTTSLLCALYLLLTLFHAGAPVQYEFPWLLADKLLIPFGYLLDPLSLLMLTIVATVSFLVQVYSVGYMAGDPGYSRYYAFQSLFAWAMMSMVISPSMLQLFIFWELVGLASYLLIGFYYEKWSASQAGKKAFVMTRLGDIGFFLGLIILLLGFGNLSILKLNEAVPAHTISPHLLTLSAVLIFGGVMGKSAQFPLLTWLPDAMEGPTPVSALLHSATMVAAGVYMFSRIFPFYSGSPEAMTMALAIGTITMLISSTMAMATYDLKQVWAYSTVSQLGFMVMALAAGGYFAGVFHLTTHAGFKALLFLCSGIFIHEYHTNDFREIGKQGGRRLVIPMTCMTIGALALSGIFPFSGFFSKEAVLGVLAGHSNRIWLLAGLLGALMTAYYSFRLIFFMLFPKGGIETHEGHEDAGHGGHAESHRAYIFWSMAVPVMILAGLTLVLGFSQDTLQNFLVGKSTGGINGAHAVAAEAGNAHGASEGHSPGHYMVLVSAVSVALAGIAWAWIEFGRRKATQEGFLRSLPRVEELFARRWYLDAFLRKFLDTVIYSGVTSLFTRNDRRIIDGGIDGMCNFTVESGRLLSYLQSGMLQHNLLVMIGAVALVVLYFLI